MIDRYTPEGVEYYIGELFLLLEICDYLLAPEITPDEAVHVKVLIETHHAAFANLYPDASVISKMHFMIHMPRLIIR